jgi:hypothetical protein
MVSKKVIFLGLVGILPYMGLVFGCAGIKSPNYGKAGSACEEGEVVRTELYFGLSMPGGGVVSESQWEEFVDGYITTKFKKGLTVVDANGQWVGETGEVIKEGTKMVILVHSDSKDAEEAIGYIREKYKELFEQESVLRVSDCVEADF